MTPPDRPAPSVSRRLLGLLLLPLALLLGFGVFIDYRTGSAPIRAAYDRALHEMALAVAAHLHDADADGRIDADLPPQAVAVLRADSVDSIYYVVRAADGHVVSGDADLPPPPAGGSEYSDETHLGESVRMVTHAAVVGHTPVTISIAETTRKRTTAIRSILTSVVLTDIVQLAGTLLLVWLGVRYGVRPLRALGEQIAQRSARDLAPLDREQVPAEVRPLVNTLNGLFDTVRDTARAQQQFLADAAHQLRTPLSGVIAQLDLLAREARDEGLRARLAALHEGTRRLAHTANQLLALARSERSATTHDDFDDVDLAELAADVVAQYLDRSLLAQIDLGAETTPAHVVGSAWLLRELLGNLVDNALRYTPPGGRVTVRCASTNAIASLEGEDDGPGIPREQRANVLERFRRLPGSPGDGCGLGLAIVDEIARAHEARFSIGSGAGGLGTFARIEFRERAP
jgi:two-component system sensor histidine kinase TctE